MEHIKETIFNTTTGKMEPDLRQLRSSSTETIPNIPNSESGINANKILGQIIDRARMGKGWNPYPEDTQILAIQTWFEILNTSKVPPSQYNELYRRASVQRSNVLAIGKEPPEMSAELMLAQWSNLRFELDQQRINSGKYLPETAESSCQHCYGTGFRREFRFDHNRKIPGVVRCEHPAGEVINKL